MIDHSHVVWCQLYLTTEQRYDCLGVIVGHLGIVEAVKQRRLLCIEQRNALQNRFRLTDEGLDGIADRLRHALHQLRAVAAVVVLHEHAGHAVFLLDIEGYAELGCVQLQRLNLQLLTIDDIVVDDAHLVGKHDFGRKVIVIGNL